MKILLNTVLFFSLCGSAMAPIQDIKRGTFILVGGGSFPEEAKKLFFSKCEGKVLVIPYASGPGDDSYLSKWNGNAVLFKNTNQIRLYNKVWFSGGCQERLATHFKNTNLVEELNNLLSRGGLVGGTSAGASIMGKLMPYNSGSMPGFSLLDMVIDQHFSERNRLKRLSVLVSDSHLTGVGIDESTALVVEHNSFTVYGKGRVTLCSPSSAHPVTYGNGERFSLTNP